MSASGREIASFVSLGDCDVWSSRIRGLTYLLGSSVINAEQWAAETWGSPVETSSIYLSVIVPIRIHLEEDLQDGGGVRRGNHLPPHKYIKNTTTCGTTPIEHLLNTGRRPQTSQKARNSPRTWDKRTRRLTRIF